MQTMHAHDSSGIMPDQLAGRLWRSLLACEQELWGDSPPPPPSLAWPRPVPLLPVPNLVERVPTGKCRRQCGVVKVRSGCCWWIQVYCAVHFKRQLSGRAWRLICNKQAAASMLLGICAPSAAAVVTGLCPA